MAPTNQVLWTLLTAIINSTHSIYLIELSLGFQMALASSRIISWRPWKPLKPFRFVPDLIYSVSEHRVQFSLLASVVSISKLNTIQTAKRTHGCIYSWAVFEMHLFHWYSRDSGVTRVFSKTHTPWGCQFPGLWHLLADVISSGGGVAKRAFFASVPWHVPLNT